MWTPVSSRAPSTEGRGADAGRRRYLLDRGLLYLFSYDVELEPAREEIGFVPGGVRLNAFCRPGEGTLYHVLRERAPGPAGIPALRGTVIWGGDWALLREDDVAISDIRMTIRTDDGALIDSAYRAVVPLGAGGFRGVVGDSGEAPAEVAEHPVVIAPRYWTSAARYRWLTEQQCVGFGRLQVVRGDLARVSYDIYTMD